MKIDQLFKKVESFFPYAPKKQIEEWDFIFVVEQYYRGEVQIMFSQLKCQSQIEWKVFDNPMQKQSLFLLKISDRVVKDMAHDLKILKIKNKKSFQIKLKEINLLIYTTNKQANPNLYNYLCFLRARLYPENKQVYEQEKYSAFNKYKESKYPLDDKGKLFNSEEELRAKYHFLLTYSEEIKGNTFNVDDTSTQPFNNIMHHQGFIQLVPIHRTHEHRYLMLESVKNYVGSNTQCYFQFVSFLQKWLVFPMIIGLLAIFLNSYFDYDADNSPFDFIYALIIMIWSILFITRWQQIQKWIKIKQTSGRSQIWTQSQEMISTKNLERKYSLITGKSEYHLPMKQSVILRILSNFLCFSMMIGTLVFIIYSLNARGFIDPDHKLFYSQTVSSWAAAGGIFDSKTFYGQIPNLVHVLVTNGFDQNVYRPTVRKLAKFQNHASRKGYENSIILKYFVYEFVITFADLFYIAFVRFDIDGLRDQLLSLFFIDIVRRVVAESVVPWVFRVKQKRDSFKYYQNDKVQNAKVQNVEDNENQSELRWGAILQINKPDYEPFDDYLQIITNIGYLVMISSCFPLAPLLILIAHQVQLIQDKYKVVHIFKRKLPESYVGMGRWKNIIVFICYFSIVTNIMLFAFSSRQVVSFFPKLYEGGKDWIYGDTDISTMIGVFATGIIENIGDLVSANVTQDIGISSDIINALNPESSSSELIPELIQPQCESEDNCRYPQQSLIPSPDSILSPESSNSSPFVLKQFVAPNKQSEVTFMGILFFIQHFFLLLFIFIRDLLQRRKSEADIFLERRDYKRRVKKNLPKNVLDPLIANLLVTTWIEKEMIIPTVFNNQSRIQSKNEDKSISKGEESITNKKDD